MKKSFTALKRRYVSVDELMIITGLGKNRARELGILAGSRIKFGRRTMYDLKKIEQYMDTLIVKDNIAEVEE